MTRAEGRAEEAVDEPSSSLRSFGTALLDLVYPPRCAACGEGLASSFHEPFCPVCADAVEPLPPGCPSCGLPGLQEMCGACLADPPAFSRCSAGGLFGGPLADAIHLLKYGDRPALARPLGTWFARRIGVTEDRAVVPVPLGRRRRIARGYDQTRLLARHVARVSRARFLPAALSRVRETAPQVGLGREERRANVKGAFLSHPVVLGEDLLLVDDVVTTGSTVRACAEALMQAGARSVQVAALARAG